MSEPDSANRERNEGVADEPLDAAPSISPRETRRRYVHSVLVIASTGAALIAAGEILARLADTRAVEFPAAVLIGVGAATQAFLVIPELLTLRRLRVGAASSAFLIFLPPLWVLTLFAVTARSPFCLIGLLGVAALAMPLRLRPRILSTELSGEKDPANRSADNGSVADDEAPRERRLGSVASVSAGLYTMVLAIALGVLAGGSSAPHQYSTRCRPLSGRMTTGGFRIRKAPLISDVP